MLGEGKTHHIFSIWITIPVSITALLIFCTLINLCFLIFRCAKQNSKQIPPHFINLYSHSYSKYAMMPFCIKIIFVIKSWSHFLIPTFYDTRLNLIRDQSIIIEAVVWVPANWKTPTVYAENQIIKTEQEWRVLVLVLVSFWITELIVKYLLHISSRIFLVYLLFDQVWLICLWLRRTDNNNIHDYS